MNIFTSNPQSSLLDLTFQFAMPDLVTNTFRTNTVSSGMSSLREIGTVLHPLVHVVEQPIMNITEEVKQTVSGVWTTSQHLSTLAAWWLMAYIGYSFVVDVFEPEVQSLGKSVRNGFKRARIL